MFFPTFDMIVGHQRELLGLRSALAAQRPPHAQLFFGPKGVGKATLAAAYAQALFCSSSQLAALPTGCGHCLPCRKTAANQHPDLRWLGVDEGKTQISVDQIRDLIGFFSLTPLESSWKVAIIDDAALMNTAAANALLKTLEEPPAQSILILVSNRPGALLPTIRSRCAKTRLQPLSQEEMMRVLAMLGHVDALVIAQAVAISGTNLTQALVWCEQTLQVERARLQQEIDTLPKATLAMVCAMSAYWSKPEHFLVAMEVLQSWFRERIRGSVAAGLDRKIVAEWLALAKRLDELMLQSGIYNLNKRLVIESVLISLARQLGAAV